MAGGRENLGAFVRRKRMEKEIGLREMANIIGLSPTYQSKVERDEFPPPAEDKVKAMAKILEIDTDDLLARAGRVASDISEIIKRNPVELAAFTSDDKRIVRRGHCSPLKTSKEDEGGLTMPSHTTLRSRG